MWTRIENLLPPVGEVVMTKIEDKNVIRNEQNLRFERNLWWTGDTYVYYTPTHWWNK